MVSEGSGVTAECPECGYRTRLFDEDVTANPVDENEILSIHECPECDPEHIGDPTTDRTPRLEVIETHV